MNDAQQKAPATGPGSEIVPAAGVVPTSAFDFLLRADDSAPVPDGAETGVPLPNSFDFSDRPEPKRPTPTILEWAALALAVLLPPLGLVLAVVAGFLSRAANGWTTWVVRTATVLGVILTIALIIGGIVLDAIARADSAEAKIVADSRPFCASLETTPGILESPAFGWPVDSTSIEETVVAMKEYQLRWKDLAAIAPAGIATETRAIAFAAQSLVTGVESTRVIDRAGNLSQMTAVTQAAGIPAWVTRYCP